MARLTIRLPDELYDRLAADADAAGVPPRPSFAMPSNS